MGTLDHLLKQPMDTSWRIDGVLPSRGRLLLTAKRKAGKTTLAGNLNRSLITGEPFLGRFDVEKIDGRVVVLNYEVGGAQYARWQRDLGIPPDRLFIINLR